MKRLLLSALALILLACRATTGTPSTQSHLATTTTSAPAAEATRQTIQAGDPTLAPPVQTSPSDSTPQISQTDDPTPAPPVQFPATGFTPQVTQVGARCWRSVDRNSFRSPRGERDKVYL